MGEIDDLLAFAAASRTPAGFGWLDAAGRVEADRPPALWVTCRMTHVYAVAMRLDPQAPWGDLLDHGVTALLDGPLRDTEHGGWYAAVGEEAKEAYAHAFVVLAGASTTTAGHPRGRELLTEAIAVLRDRFWDDAAGMCVDSWNRDFAVCDPYRGLNANMHAVEALLAAEDAGVGASWASSASLRIAARVADDLGPAHDWRLPEHFDEAWRPLPDFNRDHPADPFRPYGVTVGHLFEWARLLAHRDVASAEPRFAAASRALYDRARSSEAADGVPGFPYTTDFGGAAIVRERMHWVIAEAMAAATALGEDADRERFAAFAAAHHRDPIGGSWWHELDIDLRPGGVLWPGKPDVYHALQALWLPQLWPCASFAGVRRPRRS